MTGFEPGPAHPPVDRTEELLLAMLARRAGRPVPAGLLADTMRAVAASGRARASGQGHPAAAEGSTRSWRFGPGTTLVLAAVVLLGVVGGGLLGSALLRAPGSSGSSPPAIGANPSPAAERSIDPASATGSAGASGTPGADPSPDPGRLLPDSLAIVTKAGNPLLVRSAPGTGDDSQKIGTLASGTRALVLRGPVAADGYDWYEILTDGQPTRRYGWVARGPADDPWLKRSTPKCWESLTAATIQALSRIDMLACYHDTEVTIRGHWRNLRADEVDPHPCTWDEVTGPCNPNPAWLLAPTVRISYEAEDGTAGYVNAAVPDEVRPRLDAIPADATVTATIAMDVEEARGCSVGDPRDETPPSPVDRAVAGCRVRWVLRNVSWNDGVVRANSVARVMVDGLPIRVAPDPSARTAGRSLRAGDRVYVVGGPTNVDGTDWLSVLWQDRDTVYGWVPAAQKGKMTLAPRPPACPGMADWAAFKELEWWERMACFGDRTVSVDMWLHAAQPQPERSLACGYWALKATTGKGGRPGVADARCLATPTWLAGLSGLTGRRRGGIEAMLAYDSATVDVSSLGAGLTWARVTGSFMNPAASECRVLDRVAGLDLVPPEEAATYCRGIFVVTAIGPAAGPEPK